MGAPDIASPLEFALQEEDRCSSCGACMSVCPVYGVGQREELVARGKLKLIQAMSLGQLPPARELADTVGRCLLCGRCADNCPNLVEADKAMQAGRQVLAAQAGVPAVKRLVLEKALPQPGRLDGLARAGRLAHPLAEAASGLNLRLPGLAGAERLPAPAAKPYLAGAPRVVPGPKGAPTLGFFVGCVSNYLRPELANKAVEMLSRRYTVVIPPDQGCCGLPALAAGLNAPAGQLALRHVEAFSRAKVDRVVTACGSCAFALARHLPELVPPRLGEAAQKLAAGVMEIGQVLAEHPKLLASLGAARQPIALHHPCHLLVGLKTSQESLAVLQAAGADLADMPGGDQCCGGGGLFSLNEPELSQKIFQPRARELAASGAKVLATSCSGCYLQWRRGLPGDFRVVHPIEIIGQ